MAVAGEGQGYLYWWCHMIIIIIIIIIFIISLLWEFFTPTLADGFSPEFEWQQVSLSPQDSSQYSSRS